MSFSKTECKWLTFRGYSNLYFDPKTYSVKMKHELRLLKRRSCPGCKHCNWIYDDLRETLDNVILPDIIDGELYTIQYVNEHKDWETGIVDDYNLEFIHIKSEEEINNLVVQQEDYDLELFM